VIAFRLRRGRLYYLLVSLVLFIVLYSFRTGSLARELILDLTMVGVLISVAVGIRQTRRSLIISLLLGIPWVVTMILDLFIVVDHRLYFATSASGLVFLVYVTTVIFRHLVRARQVTADTIFGAISVYLLLGIAWGTGYRLMESVSPVLSPVPVGSTRRRGWKSPAMCTSASPLSARWVTVISPRSRISRGPWLSSRQSRDLSTSPFSFHSWYRST